MSPLAHRFIKELTLPVRRRGTDVHDPAGIGRRLLGAHCFDFTPVPQLLMEVRRLLPERQPLAVAVGILGDRAFLPADSTWIECMAFPGVRCGYLLERSGDAADVWVAMAMAGQPAGAMHVGRIPIENPATVPELYGHMTADQLAGDLSRIYASLAIINTPRLIGRRQHMPHRGLERQLLRACPTIGTFPLRAWTEITLSVAAMMTEADGTIHEAHLTGEKCLHFCRAHLRIRNGRLEQVKAHWRGNPALGIKRSRYRIAA